MKKVRLFLLLLMAVMMPLAMFGQNTLTVNDGTTTNNYIPVLGTYTDTQGSTSEFIIPSSADGMDGLANGVISKLTFYLSSPATAAWTATINVYMAEVSNTTLSNVVGPDACTIVYTGTLDATGSTMEINLDNPYTYQGGNLLIGTYVQVAGNWKSATYYGVTATGAGCHTHGSVSVVDFMPKTTFTYTGGTVISCPKPTALECTGKTATTASLSWTAVGSETTWTLEYGTAADFTGATSVNVTENPTKELTGLTPNTTYYARVKAVCTAGTDESDWGNVLTFTTRCNPETDLPWTEDFEDFQASSSGVTLNEPCWENEHLSGTGAYFFEVYSSTSATGGNSTKMLRLHDMSNGTQTKLVLPSVTIPTANAYQFVIDVYRNATGSSYTSEGVRVFASTDGEIEGATELGFLYRNCTQTDGGVVVAESASGWYTYEFNIPFAGTCYIILRGESQYGSATYMDNFIVRKAPTCFKPTEITTTNATPTSATISWDNPNTTGPLSWTVRMGEMDTTVATNSFTFNNLTPSTSYTVQVKANCAADDTSEWATGTFRTLYGIPFVEPFNATSLPDDWTRYSGLLTNVMGGTDTLGTAASPMWNFGTANGLFDSHARINIYGANCKGWLVTPTIVMDEDVKLSFDLALCKYTYQAVANPVADTAQQDDKFVVLVTTDAGTTWTILRQYDNAGSEFVYNSIATEGEMVVIDMAAYAGQNIQIAFYGESTVDGNGDNNLHIDNVQLVTCIAPSDVTVDSNITATSATIGWTDFGTPASWTIKVNDVVIPATTNPFTLTDLTPATIYTVQVKANCTADDESAWSSEVYFVTECPETFVVREANPFHEGFEGGSVSCWSTEQAEGAGSWWIGSTASNAYEGTHYAIAPYTPGNVTRLVSPVIDLSQVENPVLSYAHFQAFYQDTLLDVLTVYYRTSETSDWVLIANYADSSYTTYVEETHELPEPSATYQISFLASSNDGYNILVDDINITGTDIPEPCAVPANVTVSEENVVTWEGTAASYNVMVIVGEDTTTANVTTNTYTIEGLEAGTQGTVAVQAVCAEDDLSEWSEAVAFTIAEGISNHAISANIFPNPTTGNVTVESNAIGADITVFDMFGKLMMTSKVAAGRTELNFSGIAPGVYMVRIANDNAVTTVKVVKE